MRLNASLRSYDLRRRSRRSRNNPTWRRKGWQGDDCGYFDAVEAADFFVPLMKTEEEQHDHLLASDCVWKATPASAAAMVSRVWWMLRCNMMNAACPTWAARR